MTVTKENERADIARAGLRARKPCVESSELPAVCYLYGAGGVHCSSGVITAIIRHGL